MSNQDKEILQPQPQPMEIPEENGNNTAINDPYVYQDIRAPI